MNIKTEKGAVVNLSALLKFNEDLIHFKYALDGYFDNITSSLRELEQGWQDEKLEEFKIVFNQYAEILKPLGEELEHSKKHMEEYWIPIIQKYLDKKVTE